MSYKNVGAIMRSYAVDNTLDIKGEMLCDVIVVGAGVAGLYAALNLDEELDVILLNKLEIEESNSVYAQGGIASILLSSDSFEQHFEDTLRAGGGICDKEAVTALVKEGPSDIQNLIKLGVPFDRDENNDLAITKEGAHSCNRIVHCGGDATGLHLTKTLIENVKKRKNITTIENINIIDILTDESNFAAGVIAQNEKGEMLIIKAGNIIIASGGIGRLYRNSTNSICSTGDGIAAAVRAGALTQDMEFVQFHPTALIHPGSDRRYFLISEALRGEGAVLRNRKGERFMQSVHEMADLAPRDVVSRAIISEMKKHDLPCVYLDITSKNREILKKRFPQIYEKCLNNDIDIAVNWIPVVPVQHYFMGGIKSDLHGRTNIEGLYVCGESACTGVHGGNRLASNSLLECLVFGRRSAEHINGKGTSERGSIVYPIENKQEKNIDYQTYRSKIRTLMSKNGGIIRNEKELTEAIDEIDIYYRNLSGARLRKIKEIETLNIATVALEILKAARSRKESIGAHYRSDSEI